MLRQRTSNSKLVLECEDDITTEINYDWNLNWWWKNNIRKNNCLIHTISLLIICLLLLAVPSIGSYYYYTRDWVKKNKRHVNIKWIT